LKTSQKTKARQETPGFDQLAIERIARKGGASLAALVSDLSSELGCSKDVVTEGLMGLQERKAIVIAEKTPHVSLASYAASPKSLWFWGAAGATLLSIVFVFATSGLALYPRYVFGGLLILFLPGYSLIEMLYPTEELDGLARLALSIGLSLALVPLVALVLNYTPFGIRLLPVAFSLSGLTLVFLAVSLKRKHAHYKLAKDVSQADAKRLTRLVGGEADR